MKNISALLLLLFNSLILFSRDLPPPRAGNANDPCMIPGACSVPIDDYLPLLFFVALLFGVWGINKFRYKSVTDKV